MFNLREYYDIGPISEIHQLPVQSINRIYCVSTNIKKYILKFYSPESRISANTAALAQSIVCKEAQISPRIFTNRRNQLVTEVGTSLFSLQEFAFGKPFALTEKTLDYFLFSLANLHKCLHKHFINIITVKDGHPMTCEDIRITMDQAQNSYLKCDIKIPAFEQLLTTRYKMQNKYNPEYMPNSFHIIHADLRPSNIIDNGSDLKYIDFDYLRYGDLLYEIGSAISLLSNYNQTVCEAFVKQYSEVTKASITTQSLFSHLLSYYIKSNFPLNLLAYEPIETLNRISCERIKLINFCYMFLAD